MFSYLFAGCTLGRHRTAEKAERTRDLIRRFRLSVGFECFFTLQIAFVSLKGKMSSSEMKCLSQTIPS